MPDMSEVYETLHLSGPSRNVELLGTYVAWLVSNNLLDPQLDRSAASSIARVRMQDLTGPEFLTTVLHGELKPSHLNETGRDFSRHYFVSGKYHADYNACEISGEDDWLRYDEISPKITAAFKEFTKPKNKIASLTAKIIQFPSKRS